MQQFFTSECLISLIIRNHLNKYAIFKNKITKNLAFFDVKSDPTDFELFIKKSISQQLGINVILEGILKVNYNIIKEKNHELINIVYVTKKDEFNIAFSEKFEWMDLKEISDFIEKNKDFNGKYCIDCIKSVENNIIYPLQILANEGSEPVLLKKL